MKLLLTHVPLARRQYYGARALARLHELVEVRLHEGSAPLDPKGLIAAAGGVDLIIADRATAVPAEVFNALPALKVVMRSAIDIRNIDQAAASKAGVLVTHAEAGFVKSVVELTVGFLVDLSRGITRAATSYHRGEKPEIRIGRQLSGSTVGIIGYGRISRDLAPVLAALGMKVMVSDPYAQVDDRRFLKLPLEEMLGLADYVICLAIANEETENLVDEAAFARMKPDAFFINMSRGTVVDDAALIKALREKTIYSAGLDVFVNEPEVPKEYLEMENIVLFPHLGSGSVWTRQKMEQLVVDNLLAWNSGKAPLTPVPETPWPPKK